MTHHSPVLLALDDLEQVKQVLVEIEDLRAQLKVRVAQQIHLIVLLNVLSVKAFGSETAHATNHAHRTCTHFTVKLLV